MTLSEFEASLHQEYPPESINSLLKALWFDRKGNWEAAHNIAQDIDDQNGSRVHAYLHRKEGDLSNASYWYHLAQQPIPKKSLQEEWKEIVRIFLEQH